MLLSCADPSPAAPLPASLQLEPVVDSQRQCSSCGRSKGAEEFTGKRPTSPTQLAYSHSCFWSGRATCNSCRTRKRLKSAAQVSERRQKFETLQFENQRLRYQLSLSESKLTASDERVAKLVELLQKQNSDILSKHAAEVQHPADAAASDSSYEDSPNQSCNSLPPQSTTAAPLGVNSSPLRLVVTCLNLCRLLTSKFCCWHWIHR